MMIWFEELTSRKKISKLFSKYEKTFPEEERRNKEQFLNLTENAFAYIYEIKTEENNIGYIILWKLSDFYFLEHFEVFEEFRNQNYGTEILQTLTEKFDKIILESEPENLSDIAQRRISFYERNGFFIIDKNYIQPSYGDGKPNVPLYLLSNFIPDTIQTVINRIKEIVYEK